MLASRTLRKLIDVLMDTVSFCAIFEDTEIKEKNDPSVSLVRDFGESKNISNT